MQYSIFNRFRGSLVGLLLPQRLTTLGKEGLGTKPDNSVRSLSTCSKIALVGIDSLIHCGTLDLTDWDERANRLQLSVPSSQEMTLSSSEAVVAILPILLFFHEDLLILEKQLQLVSKRWQLSAAIELDVLVIGTVISQILKSKVDSSAFIDQILVDFKTIETGLIQQLKDLQMLLKKGSSLQTALSCLNSDPQLDSTPLALALYCFLSTPEDFRLSLTRAAQISDRAELTPMITGILSGLYNAYSNIPLSWRLMWDRTERDRIVQQADRLVAVWSGVYNITTTDWDRQPTVAAPPGKK